MTILAHNHPNGKYWEDQANQATEALVKLDKWEALLEWRDKALTYSDTWQDIAMKSQKRLHELSIAQPEQKS